LKRRQFSALAAGAALVAGLPRAVRAQVESPVIATAADYTTIKPPLPMAVAAGTVSVVEFFSFACPWCYAFETPLEAWLQHKPPAIRFRRAPVPFESNFRNFQPMYLALETMGLADAMARKIFDAVHKDHLRLDKPEDIAAFMKRNGVDADRFMEVFASPDTRAKVTMVNQAFVASGANAVPMMMVQGRFLTSPTIARGYDKALAVVDRLAAQVLAGG
jgi:thiol:disulfide interchange protein DsbA